MRARALLQQRGLKPEDSAPNPDPQSATEVPPSGLYSNIVQLAIQQLNVQEPYVDNSIPHQQAQEVRDVKPVLVPNAFAGDQTLQTLAFNRQQLQLQQQQLLQQQQQQQHQQLLLHQQQQLYGQDNVLLGSHMQQNAAQSMLQQDNTQQQPMMNTLPMSQQHVQITDGSAAPVVNVHPAEGTLHNYMNNFQMMNGNLATIAVDMGSGDQSQHSSPQGLDMTYMNGAPFGLNLGQHHQQAVNGNPAPILNAGASEQNLHNYANTNAMAHVQQHQHVMNGNATPMLNAGASEQNQHNYVNVAAMASHQPTADGNLAPMLNGGLGVGQGFTWNPSNFHINNPNA